MRQLALIAALGVFLPQYVECVVIPRQEEDPVLETVDLPDETGPRDERGNLIEDGWITVDDGSDGHHGLPDYVPQPENLAETELEFILAETRYEPTELRINMADVLKFYQVKPDEEVLAALNR